MPDQVIVEEESRIPKQVADGAIDADKLLAEMHEADSGTDPAPEKPVIDLTQDGDLNQPEHTSEVDGLKAELKTLQQKHDVIQGMYNTDVKALGDNPQLVQGLKADRSRLERQVNDLTSTVSDLQKAKPKEEPPASTSVTFTEEEIAQLASDGIEGNTLEILKSKLSGRPDGNQSDMAKDLSDRVKTIEANAATVEEREALASQKQFFTDLLEKVPNWKQINGSKDTGAQPMPEWDTHMATKPPYSTLTFREILANAQGRFDVTACAQVFEGFIKANETLFETQKVVDDKHKINPADRVEPDTSSVTDHEDPAKPILKEADYKKLMDDFTKGRWKGNEEEFLRQKKTFETAITEKRLQ